MQQIEILQNPYVVHAVLAHLPVALAVVALAAVLLGAATKMRNPTLRWVTVGLYALMAASAYIASSSGAAASHELANSLPPDVQSLLDKHRFLAGYAWVAAVVAGVVVMFSGTPSEWSRAILTVVSVMAGTTVLVYFGAIGYYGTSMVYLHGVGVKVAPDTAADKPPIAPPPFGKDQATPEESPAPAPTAEDPDGANPLEPVSPANGSSTPPDAAPTPPAPAAETAKEAVKSIIEQVKDAVVPSSEDGNTPAE